MTETCQEFPVSGFQTVCRICLGANGIREMSYQQIVWYQTMTESNTEASSCGAPWSLCWVCAHLLRKYMGFRRQCKNALEILLFTSQKPNTHLVLPEKAHSFSQGPLEVDLILPTAVEPHAEVDVKHETKHEEIELKTFSDIECDERNPSDDDLPLVTFKEEEVETKKVKKKKSKKGGKSKTFSLETVLDCQKRDSPQTARAQPREGFSSRMRQETEEYIVIKLTKEQVLSEMKTLSQSERYLQAPYKCATCVRPFNFRDVLHAHMRKHSEESGSFQCEMCSQYCPSAVSLRGHIKSHTTRYRCKVCGAERRSRQHLLEHHREHCDPTLLSALPYTCKQCPFATAKRTVIQRHVRTEHAAGGGERHQCESCARVFRTVEALRVHTSRRHEPAGGAVCGVCGRKFVYASALRAHTQSVHQRSDYYCVECDMRFRSPYNLQLHFKRAKRHRDTAPNA